MNLKEEEGPLISSGFLLYSYAVQTNDVYFLLGQESYHPEWPYSNRWCDFCGTKKPLETESECAARELMEETFNCVQFDPPRTLDLEQILSCIQQREYLCCISAYFPVQGSIQARKRICYVKEIPWQPNLPELFARKTRLYRPFQTLTTPAERLQYWQSLTSSEQQVPFLHIIQNNSDQVIDVCIQSEWIEKSHLEWWSIPRLRQVVRNEGKFRKTYFRRGFIALLKVILEIFSRAKHFPTSLEVQNIISDLSIRQDSNVVLNLQEIPWNRTEPLFVFQM